MPVGKQRAAGGKALVGVRAKKRDKTSRQKIIIAARKVFSEHPYPSAGIRMIGKEAGVDFPLVMYYFPSKAALFTEVIELVCQELVQANQGFLADLQGYSPEEGFDIFLDRCLDFHFARPELLRTITLNINQFEAGAEIPALDRMNSLLRNGLKMIEALSPPGRAEAAKTFYSSLSILIFYYLGSRTSMAAALGMDSWSAQYRRWVRDSLHQVGLPFMREFMGGDGGGPDPTKLIKGGSR